MLWVFAAGLWSILKDVVFCQISAQLAAKNDITYFPNLWIILQGGRSWKARGSTNTLS